MLPSHLTRNGMQEEEICARVLNLSLCKLKETGFHYAALKISPCCTALNLNDFRKHLFLDVFLHFVILIACKVDRIWPDFKKGILFGKKKATHSQTLFILRGGWARQSKRVFFSFCYTVNISLTFEWIWKKLLRTPLELSTMRQLRRGWEYIWPWLLIEGV